MCCKALKTNAHIKEPFLEQLRETQKNKPISSFWGTQFLKCHTDFTLMIWISFMWYQIAGFMSQQEKREESLIVLWQERYNSLAFPQPKSVLLFFSQTSHKSCKEVGSLFTVQKSLSSSQGFTLRSLPLMLSTSHLVGKHSWPRKNLV